ncbi:unnamed protein product [Moneuplotes crassus]|uniref:Uncharacterized protein n=1 Tax=Euplotes crassus TaxID=5936 RepID=A0AAD2CXZ7_EUPCR|nr:unnamed protein product [Moneuplotes crassus]
MQGSMISIIAVVVSLNIIGGMMSKSSTNSVLSSCNQLQLLVLLLLLDIFLSLKVINYLRSLSSSLFNIKIGWSFFIVFKKLADWFDYPQERVDLDMIDISSGSTLLNLNILIAIMMVFIVSHLIFMLLEKCSKKSNRIIPRFFRKVCSAFTFGMYVVLIYEGFINLCLCVFSELRRFEVTNSGPEQASSYSAFFFCGFILVIFCTVIGVWINTKIIKKKFLRRELFEGFKPARMARLHPLMFLIRRAILCLMIIHLRFLQRSLFLGLYSVVNLVHCLMICAIRPFQKVPENITEVVNEVFYLGFCSFLFFHYKETHWNNTKASIFNWVLVSNSIFNALFSITVFIYTVIKKRKNVAVDPDQGAYNNPEANREQISFSLQQISY